MSILSDGSSSCCCGGVVVDKYLRVVVVIVVEGRRNDDDDRNLVIFLDNAVLEVVVVVVIGVVVNAWVPPLCCLISNNVMNINTTVVTKIMFIDETSTVMFDNDILLVFNVMVSHTLPFINRCVSFHIFSPPGLYTVRTTPRKTTRANKTSYGSEFLQSTLLPPGKSLLDAWVGAIVFFVT